MSVLDGRTGWTQNGLSELEIKFVVALRDVMDALGGLLQPGTNGLVALALERGLSLPDVTELVATARRAIVLATTAAYPEGVRGAWRRFRSRGDTLAEFGREVHIARALCEGVRVVRALAREDALDAYTLKLADLTTLRPFEWRDAAAALDRLEEEEEPEP
jgi:hypothetical protein